MPRSVTSPLSLVKDSDLRSKNIYIEAVTLRGHVEGPIAIRLRATPKFIDTIKNIASTATDLGLKSATLNHEEDLFIPDCSETGLTMDELVIEPSGAISFGGTDRVGARTETRYCLIEDIEQRFNSENSVEVMPPVSHVDTPELIHEILMYKACEAEDIEALQELAAAMQLIEAPAPTGM